MAGTPVNVPEGFFPARIDALEDGVEIEDEAELLAFDFTPVPRRRVRRDGWSEEKQRLFIALLAKSGCVARAARAVGMTPRSAYRLLDADGADSFAEATGRRPEERSGETTERRADLRPGMMGTPLQEG